MKKSERIININDLKLVRERIRSKIIKEEYAIRDSYHNLLDSVTPATILDQFFDSILNRPDLAVKIGFIIVSLLTKKRAKKKKIRK